MSFSAADTPDLKDKVIVVTGGNAGLGFEMIRQLAQHNPTRIYLASRSAEKGNAAIQEINKSIPNAAPISLLTLDLSSFESIKAAAKTFRERETRLDILVNNAGIMMTPEGLTKEGYEIQFGTNHMGHAFLTHLLLPVLRETTKISSEVRVVSVSSATEARAPGDIYKFDEFKTTMSNRGTTVRYGISKIANLHYSSALAQHYPEVKFIAVHPGMVVTDLHRNSTGFLLRLFLHAAVPFGTPVEKGVLNQLWAAVSQDAENGGFYAPVASPWTPSKNGRNTELRDQLYDWTQEEIGKYFETTFPRTLDVSENNSEADGS
ncbi:hypothetical protein O1611_g5604 [Lasiodiplodia mahajangana]|uniref:Uncharacterized protein n=1 Tax=Lasiodiplodia mahajangana TaxID=1108764 RepID=A0ACC2JLF5_9PEZI|nr:hypothetical protein O1611_g5604 [Lasiodiplodia mahajangana]